MIVSMVDIGIVRMRVAHRAMPMEMGVRLAPLPIGIVKMPMMHIMHV